MTANDEKSLVQSTKKPSSPRKKQLSVPASFQTKNALMRINGAGRVKKNTAARMRRAIFEEEMQSETDGSKEPIVLIEDDQDPNAVDDEVDEDDEEKQQEESMNDEAGEDDPNPASATKLTRPSQQRLNVTRTPIPRTPEQRMRNAMIKLKDPNLHLRKKDELSVEETKKMDAAWLEMQTAFGVPRSEFQFGQLLNKLPEIMEEYVTTGETYNYLYEKAVEERGKREVVTGRFDNFGSSSRYFGPTQYR
uniref:Nucleolar protein 16 n=1 Tax=Plectus sambesii TaxID=2011161 RepID=A0A914XQH0_9BILA